MKETIKEVFSCFFFLLFMMLCIFGISISDELDQIIIEYKEGSF